MNIHLNQQHKHTYQTYLWVVGIMIALLSSSCRQKSEPDRPMDICDPQSGFFKGGEHFIDADTVNEDGTINRLKVLERYPSGKRPCHPSQDTLPSQRPF